MARVIVKDTTEIIQVATHVADTCNQRGGLLTVLFFAGQSTGPAGAPFSDPALTPATNTNNKAITTFIVPLRVVLDLMATKCFRCVIAYTTMGGDARTDGRRPGERIAAAVLAPPPSSSF